MLLAHKWLATANFGQDTLIQTSQSESCKHYRKKSKFIDEVLWYVIYFCITVMCYVFLYS